MLTFEEFSQANRERQKDFGNGAGGHNVEELALCVAEEAGEIAAAVLGWSGAKARKAHLTAQDIADEAADAITYLDLLIQRLGFRTEAVLRSKFNRVSERCGSKITLPEWDIFWAEAGPARE